MHDPLLLHDSGTLRAIETRAAAAMGDDFKLMRRAGVAAWREVLAQWPGARRIVVACGPGNNGGDGYVLARQAHASGRRVTVVRLQAHAPTTDNARRAEAEFLEAQGRIEAFDGTLPDADLVVDALFGIGLSREPDADTAALIKCINEAGVTVLSLDVPSGVDADHGAVPGAAVVASCTLQFIAGHPGLATGAGIECAGHRALAALDVPVEATEGLPARARLLPSGALAGAVAPRRRNAHKGDAGHVLCIGGDHGSAGAIALSAEAALRSGAGLVSVATRAEHVGAVLARRPEVMVRGVAEDDAAALAALLARASVVALGPGLGQQAWGRALHAAALAAGRPLVLDADALNLLASEPRALPADAVITPHPGEAARLLQCTVAAVQADRLAAADALARAYGCVVVLKGAGTIIAAVGELPLIVAAGNPGMAVGGMGDVLTGVIAALRAQGLAAHAAAATGALLHAVAGDDAAAQGGERGLLPSDLFPHLRRRLNTAAGTTLAGPGP